jgi:hypothetical protein
LLLEYSPQYDWCRDCGQNKKIHAFSGKNIPVLVESNQLCKGAMQNGIQKRAVNAI